MNRRRFLKNLSVIAAALLVAPKSALKELSSLFAPRRRFYHFAHTWDGEGKRRTWIDGKEVFGRSVQSCRDVTIDEGFYRAIGSDQGSISFWITPPDEARHIPSDGIPWTRLSDDSPFEPPSRADFSAPMDDIGEGEETIAEWQY